MKHRTTLVSFFRFEFLSVFLILPMAAQELINILERTVTGCMYSHSAEINIDD